MIRPLALIALTIVLPATIATSASPAAAASWIFRRSTYTHDPVSGERVHQYAAKEPAYARVDPTYKQSGYRHNRMSIRGLGGSADRLHIVDSWGEGESLRPYGEWQRPFRAGATPYGPWGNPQGPWTTPFDSWMNPYGLGQLPYQPYYGHPTPYYGTPYDSYSNANASGRGSMRRGSQGKGSMHKGSQGKGKQGTRGKKTQRPRKKTPSRGGRGAR